MIKALVSIRLVCLIVFTVVCTALVLAPVFAQSPSPTDAGKSGLSISPPTFELSANPGETLSNTIKLDNMSNAPVHLVTDIKNFTAVGEEGAVDLTSDQTSYSLASWISVTPNDVTVQSKSSQTFTFTIRIPATGEPGGHFGSILFRTVPLGSLQGSGSTVSQEIGTIVLLKIAGNTKEAATIVSFAPSQKLYEFGPVTLELRAANSGNVHLKPTGTITITNVFGQKVAVLPLESKDVLPGAIRRLDTTWNTKWRIGRYTATVVMVYGSSQVERAAVTTFTIIPYRLVAVVGVLVLIVGFFIHRSRRRIGLALKILLTGKTS